MNIPLQLIWFSRFARLNPQMRLSRVCQTTLLAAPNSNLTSELGTKWAGAVLNQQDLAKNGWGHLKSGWGEVDSTCAHAWHRSCKKTLSLEAAFLPVIDDLPAFVLLISMVRSPLILLLPSSLSPSVPFLSYCPPPSRPLFLHPPILPPSHGHSLTLMPSSPSLNALDPVTPSPHVSMGSIIKTSTHFWRPKLDTVTYIE